MASPAPAIVTLDPALFGRRLDRLAEILQACVREGASVGFVLPFSLDEARAYWRDRVAPAHAAGSKVVLAAVLGDEVVGTAQLDFDGMPSKRHHAEVSKVLVDPRFRRAGVARALMAEIERRAERRRPLALDPRHRGRRRRDALPFARLHARRHDPPLRPRRLRGRSLRRHAAHVQGPEGLARTAPWRARRQALPLLRKLHPPANFRLCAAAHKKGADRPQVCGRA